MDFWTQRGNEWGMNWESRTHTHTLPCVKQVASRNLLYSTGISALWWPRGVDWGGREALEGRDVCIHMADSQCCTLTMLYRNEHNIVKQLYSNKHVFFSFSLCIFNALLGQDIHSFYQKQEKKKAWNWDKLALVTTDGGLCHGELTSGGHPGESLQLVSPRWPPAPTTTWRSPEHL